MLHDLEHVLRCSVDGNPELLLRGDFANQVQNLITIDQTPQKATANHPKGDARSGRTTVELANFIENVFFANTLKNNLNEYSEDRSALSDAVPESGKSRVPFVCLLFLKKSFSKKKTSKNKNVNGKTDPRCQNATLSEEGKSRFAILYLAFVPHFFAAQVPGYLYTAPSLPDPTALA